MMRNKVCAATVLISLALSGNIFAQAVGPRLSPALTLSVGDMIDVMMSAGIPRRAVRGQFLSELVQSYECHLQTRWHGLEVVTEKAIDEMSYIDSLRIPENEIQAADYVICGNYGNDKNGIKGFVFCTDLTSDSGKPTRPGTFETSDNFEIPASMAKATATLLSLVPRETNTTTGATPQKDLVWVVHPFLRCAPGWGVGSSLDATLSEQVEAALQQQGVVKRIVDRQALDAILKEHNMANLPEEGSERARMLSKLTKADIRLTGQVAPWKRNFRVDLFLLDSRTGCMLAACTAKDVPQEDLSAACIRLAVRLAETPIVIRTSVTSSPAQRRREAEVLMSREHYPADPDDAFFFTRVHSELESLINAAEGAYLLVHDDDDFVYRTIEQLWAGYKRWRWWNRPRPGDTIYRYEFKSLDCMQRTACLINQALQHMEHSETARAPLLYRADALAYAGRYTEAIDLAQKHLQRYPTVEDGWAFEVIAQSHLKLGHFDLAGTFAQCSLNGKLPGVSARDILADVQRQATSTTLATAAGKDDVTALEICRKVMSTEGSWITAKDWKQYLELLRKVDRPSKALDINALTFHDNLEFAETIMLQELHGQTIDSLKVMKAQITRARGNNVVYPMGMFHIAACLAELGEQDRAARLCKDIVAYTEPLRFAWADLPLVKDVHDASEALCRKIESERGPVTEKWKSGLDVRSVGDRYRIYIVPLGPFNQGRLDAILTTVASFLGSNSVRLLPTLSVPESAAPVGGTYNYRCRPLFEGVFESLAVPEDALHVVLLTQIPMENLGLLCAGQMDDFVDPPTLSPVIVSTVNVVIGNVPESHIVRDFAWKIISSLRYIYADKPTVAQKRWTAKNPARKQAGYGVDRENCTSWECIFSSGLWWPRESMTLRLSMCPKCQREYAEADFEKIHKELLQYLTRMGVKTVKLNAPTAPMSMKDGDRTPGVRP